MSKIESKILKETNPLGVVRYLPLVRKKYFGLIPGFWHSIKVYNNNDIDVSILIGFKYGSLKGATDAIDKYIEWENGSFKLETIK